MPVEFIEIERDENWVGKGNINLVKGKYKAILHNRDETGLKSTMFLVNASREEIDAVVVSHPDVKHYPTKLLAQKRGLEIRMGTPTLGEIDRIHKEWKEIGLDIKAVVMPSISNKTIYDHMAEDLPHIAPATIKCTQCQTLNSGNANICSNCAADLNELGQKGLSPFNVTRWKDTMERK